MKNIFGMLGYLYKIAILYFLYHIAIVSGVDNTIALVVLILGSVGFIFEGAK